MNANGRKLRISAVTEVTMKDPDIVVKQGLSGYNKMKPGGLVRMANNISFEIPQIPAGLIKKSVSVPWGRAKIPEVRQCKEQDPKEKERCLRFYQRREASRQSSRAW